MSWTARNIQDIKCCRNIHAASLEAHLNKSELYLTERSHIPEGSILNDLIILAGVAHLGVALYSLGGQADTCGLAAGGIWGVQVVVPLKDHQLALGLGDMCGKGLQDVSKCHLHFCFQLSTGCQAGGQLNFVKLPAVWKKVRKEEGARVRYICIRILMRQL